MGCLTLNVLLSFAQFEREVLSRTNSPVTRRAFFRRASVACPASSSGPNRPLIHSARCIGKGQRNRHADWRRNTGGRIWGRGMTSIGDAQRKTVGAAMGSRRGMGQPQYMNVKLQNKSFIINLTCGDENTGSLYWPRAHAMIGCEGRKFTA